MTNDDLERTIADLVARKYARDTSDARITSSHTCGPTWPLTEIGTNTDIRETLAHIKIQVDQLTWEIGVIRNTTLPRLERQIINQLSGISIVVVLNFLIFMYMPRQYIIGVAFFLVALYVIGWLMVKFFRALAKEIRRPPARWKSDEEYKQWLRDNGP